MDPPSSVSSWSTTPPIASRLVHASHGGFLEFESQADGHEIAGLLSLGTEAGDCEEEVHCARFMSMILTGKDGLGGTQRTSWDDKK